MVKDSEGDAKLGGDNGEASFGPPVLPDRRKNPETSVEELNLNSTSTLYLTYVVASYLL